MVLTEWFTNTVQPPVREIPGTDKSVPRLTVEKIARTEEELVITVHRTITNNTIFAQ